MKSREWYLNFECTNESLPAIVAGLDLEEGNRVLAICGSGDQAFAMLEHAGFVHAVDNNPLQVDYARKRAKQIEEGDFLGFHEEIEGSHFTSPRLEDSRKAYFTENRLERIRDRIGSLVISNENIADINFNGANYDRAYLSNIGAYPVDIPLILKRFSRGSPDGGLVYVIASPEKLKWLSGIVLDGDLTDLAQKEEEGMGYQWSPKIFKVINGSKRNGKS